MRGFVLGAILGLLLGGGAVQAFELYLDYTVNMDVSSRTLERTCERRCEIDGGEIDSCRSASFECSGTEYIYDEAPWLNCEAW